MAGAKFGGIFVADCYDRYGNQKWSATGYNRVTDTGIDHFLDAVLTAGDTQEPTWYIGLKATTGSSADDIASTHTWTEATEYVGSRKEWVEARTAQSVSNVGNLATFVGNVNATVVEGAFLISSDTNGGTAGILLSAADFTGGQKSVSSGDSLRVTYTFTGADDGV